jgi:hypothetical protein
MADWDDEQRRHYLTLLGMSLRVMQDEQCPANDDRNEPGDYFTR